MAQVLAADSDATHTDGQGLRLALRRAADSARQAVVHPVEGTVLTVASAAADAASGAEGDCGAVARAAYEGARAALAATPGQLAVLERAGVVDAGGRGLVAVLGALVETFTGEAPAAAAVPVLAAHARVGAGSDTTGLHARVETTVTEPLGEAGECADGTPAPDAGGPAFEVIYLLEAEDAAVTRLRDRLDALGDSLVVVGGDGLWNVHVHVDDAGAAVEAGVEAGRPYRIRITHFGLDDAHTTGAGSRLPGSGSSGGRGRRPGEGLAGLYTEAGATTVLARPGEPPASGELVEAVRRAHAREVVLLPNDAECVTRRPRRPSRPAPRVSGWR